MPSHQHLPLKLLLPLHSLLHACGGMHPPFLCLQSGVVMGGTAILSAVNGLTPHVAGAIDIMVVQQPDGSLKCSPFYGTSVVAAWGLTSECVAPRQQRSTLAQPSNCLHVASQSVAATACRLPELQVDPQSAAVPLLQCGLASTHPCAAKTRRCRSLSMVGVIRPVKAAGEGAPPTTHVWQPLQRGTALQCSPRLSHCLACPLQLSAPLCMILPCLPACMCGWVCVVGEEACFSMHLGAYGQAYFAAETMEIVSGTPGGPTSPTGRLMQQAPCPSVNSPGLSQFPRPTCWFSRRHTL